MNADRLQTAIWIGLGLAVLWFAWLLTPILAPYLLAAILAYTCDPLVERLQGWRVPRTAGVLIVMLSLAGAAALISLILAPLVQKEAAQLGERLTQGLALANERLSPWLQERFGLSLELDGATLRRWLTEESGRELVGRLVISLKIGGMALAGLIANLLLAPIAMFYLLRDWPTLFARLAGLIPRRWHERSLKLLRDVDAVIAEFLRGQVMIMLLLAAYYSLGLTLVGVEFALPVGLLTGLLIFIPYVGYAAGLALTLLGAALQFDDWEPVTGVLVIFGLGQLLESFLLTPLLVGERIGLHPLAAIFAFMAFGQLFGFFGVLLALPASAVLLVALREVRSRYLESRFYRGS